MKKIVSLPLSIHFAFSLLSNGGAKIHSFSALSNDDLNSLSFSSQNRKNHSFVLVNGTGLGRRYTSDRIDDEALTTRSSTYEVGYCLKSGALIKKGGDDKGINHNNGHFT